MASFPSDYNNKEKGMPILSAEWNDIVNEIDARLPKSGGHVIGPLSIGGHEPSGTSRIANRPLTVDGDAYVKGRVSVEGQLLVTGAGEAGGRAGVGVSFPYERLHVGGPVLAHGLRVPSDERLQKNKGKMGPVLTKLLALEAFSFQYRVGTALEWGAPDSRHYSLSAEALETVFPELVSTYPENIKAINYLELIPILVHALRELSQKNTELGNKLNDMEATTVTLQQDLNVLKTTPRPVPGPEPGGRTPALP